MTKKLLKISLIFAGLLSGCIHYYYVPNIQNVPMFTEKDEYRMSVSYGLSESVSTEIQAAYSVTDHLGVMTNWISARGIDNDENSWGTGNFLEGGLGYFRPLGKSGVVELYGGAGGSRQHHQYGIRDFDPYDTTIINNNAGTSVLSFARLFVQPSMGMSWKAFDFAFSTRFCSLFFNKIDNQIDRTRNEYEFNKLDFLVHNRNHLYFEPAITIRCGWDLVKVQLQGSMASYFNSKHYFDDYHITLGIYGAISGKEWKQAEK